MSIPASHDPGPAPRIGRVRRVRAALLAAWRVQYVRRGFYGTLLIGLGALSPAYLPLSSPFWALFANAQSLATSPPVKVVGTALTMVGALLLVDAWFRLRPPEGDRVAYGAVLAIWAVPFVLAPPIFSHDAYAYAAQGWLLHNGINPYDVGPGFLPGAFADQVDWIWRMSPAPYGPLSLRISHLLVVLVGFRPYLAAWAMRAPAMLGVVLIVILLPRLARRMGLDDRDTWWFSVLNPMLVISFIGGAHNDALMMGLVVVGLWLASWPGPARWTWSRGWWWLAGAAVIGVGVAVKQPALLAAYALPLIGRGWADWSRREVLIAAGRVLASFAVTLGTFALITWATRLGYGWIHSIGVPGRNTTPAPFTMLGHAINGVLDLIHPGVVHTAVPVTQDVGIGIGAVILAVLALTVARRAPLTFLAFGYFAAALVGPSLRTWYVQWSVTLAPLAGLRWFMTKVAVWGSLVMLGFDAVEMAMRNSSPGLTTPVAISVATMVAFAWLAWTHDPWVERRALRRGDRAAHAVATAHRG